MQKCSPASRWWCGDDVVALPPHILMRCWDQHLRPDSTVWPHHTYSIWSLSGAPKIHLYCTEYIRPTTIPPEGKTTAVIGVMRGNPKDGYTCLCSNKHCKQRIVQVLFLLDSGSDGDLIFVNKDNPCCFPTQKGWFHSHGIHWMRSSRCSVKHGCSWTFSNILIAKGSTRNLMWLNTTRQGQ